MTIIEHVQYVKNIKIDQALGKNGKQQNKKE